MDFSELAALAQVAGLGAYAQYLFAGIGVAASLAAVLPPAGPDSPKWWQTGRKVLDWAAANVGNARTAVKPAAALADHLG